jgi:hypothetical protein
VISCPGIVLTDSAGVPRCEDPTGLPVAWELAVPFDPATIDPVVASAAFASGFVLVGIAWAIGKGFSILLSMLR